MPSGPTPYTVFPNGSLNGCAVDNVAAAGTTQATATVLNLIGSVQSLPAAMAVVTSATAGAAQGVALPKSFAGAYVEITNNTAVPILIYPFNTATGPDATGTINGLTGSNGVALLPYCVGSFYCVTPGAWWYNSATSTSAAYNTNAAVASTTLTAANISGAPSEVYLDLTGTLTGAANAQLPTVASLLTALHGATPGTSYGLRILNHSAGAFAWTVTTNTGWTLTGTMSIAQNTYRDFIVTLTSATTATLQAVGSGTA